MTMFSFKKFTVRQDLCAMKVGTDGVLLGAWARGGNRILDVGTGTGLIALIMAQRCGECRVLAVDIDEGAVRQSVENVLASPFAARIEVRQAMVQQLLAQEVGRFDAVVCNPPFFISSLQAPDRRRTLARHAETLTYAELMQSADRLLDDNGELSVIVPFDYRHRMDDEAVFCGFFPSRVCGVRTTALKPVRRYLLAYRKKPCPCEHSEMVIGDASYQALTGDFYL